MKKVCFMIVFFLMWTINIFSRDVYVVYDDSKSMRKDERDIYANYSLQTLVSLLNREDSLILTKMSDKNDDFRDKTILNLNDIPKELNYIEKKIIPKSNVTPYKSVISALYDMEKRENHKNKTNEDFNWLIIISDGEFEDGKPIPNIEEFKERLPSIIKKTKIKPIFLFIGSKQEELDKYEMQEGVQIWKEIYGEGGFPKIFKAINQREIVEKIKDIAELLTEKSGKSDEKIYDISKNRLTFKSQFPLKKIILIEQQDINGKINEIKEVFVNGEKTEANSLYKPNILSKNKKNIKAKILHIDAENDKLESITIIYQDDINQDNIKILPEVDAKFSLVILEEDGKEIKERIFEKTSDKVLEIIGKLETNGKPLKYISGTKLTVDYGGQKIDLKYDSESQDYRGKLKIIEGKKNIDATAEFPGYFNFQSDIFLIEGVEPKIIEKKNLEVLEPIKVNPPKLTEYTLRISSKNIENQKIKLTQEELKTNMINFIAEIENRPLSESEFKKVKLELDTTLPGKLIPGRVKYNNKEVMGWIFTPYSYEGYSNYKNPEGIYSLVASLNLSDIDREKLLKDENIIINQENKVTKEMKIDIEKMSFLEKIGAWIGTITGLLIFIIVSFGHLKKEKFGSNAKILIQEASEDHSFHPKKIEMKASIFNRLTPYIPNKKIAGGVDFYAKGKMLTMKGKQLSNLFNRSIIKKIIINGEIVDKNELSKKDEYKLFNEGKIEIYYDNGNSKKYTYYAK
ncbi:MAG: hypothetical protein ACRCZ9_03030 [Fusobacteriaceae bacterium]